ncbi:hypothetical protein BsWGS_15837 [Bradybaena similaris]
MINNFTKCAAHQETVMISNFTKCAAHQETVMISNNFRLQFLSQCRLSKLRTVQCNDKPLYRPSVFLYIYFLESSSSLFILKLQPLARSSPQTGMRCVMFTVTAINAPLYLAH